ncbi:MAG: hypothetical protein Edafosvirus20_3 [Edafosvirus sp.]|uniref:J domain-containing protein n=1 Tax=Edafosvirus sp. TaxID=2487765 RepID=A0A3G4ZYF1_9VIRU|nr:MAG: hypothetical protein Edafosvirus20_3 [Edafosvirus sp.]
MYCVNSKKNATQILNVAENASKEQIREAFKAKVSALPNNDDFNSHYNNLACAYETLTRPPSIFELMNDHFNQMFNHENILNLDDKNKDNYAYSRSFSKSFTMDGDGKMIGTSKKIIKSNNKLFSEEKHYDNSTDKVHIKQTKNGETKEYDKPFDYGNKKMLS